MPAPDEKKIEVFGPYEIYERIGVGGMASVHRAKKQGIEGFERVVALKRMLPHLADDETFIKSFVREARLASQLQHANIIQIYDLGRVGRVYYIAMEFVRGRDLRKILKQTAYATGPMPIPMVLTMARQLCDALDYAHSLPDESGEPLGIVHRDISPSNLLIAADGHLKIIDFGIAKATTVSLRTLSGRVKGKFAYMPPESVHGASLDNRSDIFSMGIVTYEMITARPLFASKNQFETIRKITQDTVPPPSHYNPACPPDLDEIVMTALAKTPEGRWQTAGAMHRALDNVAKRHGLQATNRELAEWLDWAFQQPLQSKRVEPTSTRAENTPDTTPDAVVPQADPASIEEVWGGGPPGRRSSGAFSNPGERGDEQDRQPAPAKAQSGPPARANAGPQSTMLGVAPPPDAPWKQLRDSDLSRRLAEAGAGSSQRAYAKARRAVARGGQAHEETQAVRRVGMSMLQLVLLALAGLAAAAGSYLLITHWPGKKVAGEEHAAEDSAVLTAAARTSAATTPDAAAAPDAAPAPDAAAERERPADGSPLRVSADEVTRTDGKAPRVRRSRATDDDGNPVVVHASLCIDAEGEVTSVDLEYPHRSVRRRVRETLEHWRYQPFRLDGEAIPVCFEVETPLRDH